MLSLYLTGETGAKFKFHFADGKVQIVEGLFVLRTQELHNLILTGTSSVDSQLVRCLFHKKYTCSQSPHVIAMLGGICTGSTLELS